MKLAILETGRPPAALVERFGDYPAMFERMLGDGFAIDRFDVAAGELPADPPAYDAYLITGSPAGVYDPLPWIEPLKDFLRAAKDRKLVGICFGHQIMAEAFGGQVEKSAKGWGIGLQSYAIVRVEPWMDEVATIAVPASHQDQVVDAAAEHRGHRLVAVHALCRAGLDRPPGDFLPVPSGVRTRLCQGADRRAPRPYARSRRRHCVARPTQRQCAGRGLDQAFPAVLTCQGV